MICERIHSWEENDRNQNNVILLKYIIIFDCYFQVALEVLSYHSMCTEYEVHNVQKCEQVETNIIEK